MKIFDLQNNSLKTLYIELQSWSIHDDDLSTTFVSKSSCRCSKASMVVLQIFVVELSLCSLKMFVVSFRLCGCPKVLGSTNKLCGWVTNFVSPSCWFLWLSENWPTNLVVRYKIGGPQRNLKIFVFYRLSLHNSLQKSLYFLWLNWKTVVDLQISSQIPP